MPQGMVGVVQAARVQGGTRWAGRDGVRYWRWETVHEKGAAGAA